MLIFKDFIVFNNLLGDLILLDCIEEILGLVMESCGFLIVLNFVVEEMVVFNVLG